MRNDRPEWYAIHVYRETPNIRPSIVLKGRFFRCGDCPHHWGDRVWCRHPNRTLSDEAFQAEYLVPYLPPFPPSCPWFAGMPVVYEEEAQ